MARHQIQQRRSHPAHLWSVWCSCGWVCPDLTKHPRHRAGLHLQEEKLKETTTLMQTAPHTRDRRKP